ncbi:unnamed protein product [Arabidopsis thaliana]|uniref:RRM domain-containing protein n=1 Tax=Arabidopsis thaliana TaxID=3702 RepID=A0A5S9X9V2_ARATH|nr:unnamed protein product [Arabidopsis thaliana]
MSQTNNHDTRVTKIFVGNLTWRTTADDLRRYFEQFGQVVDANVVSETYPGRSKGYGFVTFRDYVSTVRALQNSKPIIDGRTTNCNLASAGAKQNMNHPNLNGSFNYVIPPHQYQQAPQHVIPYCPPHTWNHVWGQYIYMYNNNPCYYYPTQMIHNRSDFMTHLAWHQTNRRPVIISTPPRSSVQTESISETDQELIADVAHHDNEEAVTKSDSDVDQQKGKNVKGKNIGQDGDIKQDARDQEEKINDQEDSIKQDVDEEQNKISGIEKVVENQEVKIMCEQKLGTKQDEDVTKEFDCGIEVTHQDKRVFEEVDEDTP